MRPQPGMVRADRRTASSTPGTTGMGCRVPPAASTRHGQVVRPPVRGAHHGRRAGGGAWGAARRQRLGTLLLEPSVLAGRRGIQAEPVSAARACRRQNHVVQGVPGPAGTDSAEALCRVVPGGRTLPLYRQNLRALASESGHLPEPPPYRRIYRSLFAGRRRGRRARAAAGGPGPAPAPVHPGRYHVDHLSGDRRQRRHDLAGPARCVWQVHRRAPGGERLQALPRTGDARAGDAAAAPAGAPSGATSGALCRAAGGGGRARDRASHPPGPGMERSRHDRDLRDLRVAPRRGDGPFCIANLYHRMGRSLSRYTAIHKARFQTHAACTGLLDLRSDSHHAYRRTTCRTPSICPAGAFSVPPR
ncbi:hypothetical protein CBM2609_A100083 [Cupriavidus taiwanensis]|nr:hypothetical protein CBM2604_A80082 [Cupriavidus taiwanensis]SOZ21801.1 hypothetical protein CBM2609_A100083 [Cupriavidus taiwanensis]SOZ41708.1 hypothetical protein CBM2610_A100080 [Cupriavidus taiwanensis]